MWKIIFFPILALRPHPCVYMVKLMFETGTQVKFEVNLKEKFDHVSFKEHRTQ
jgi:hypothetical protein